MKWHELLEKQRQERRDYLTSRIASAESFSEATRNMGINRTHAYKVLELDGVKIRRTAHRGNWQGLEG